MNCNNNNTTIATIAIPCGNDFRLHICGGDIVPGSPDATFADVEGLKAFVTSFLGKRAEVEHETSGSDIIVSVPASVQRCSTYGVELTGTYGGNAWRWKGRNVFRIVDSNDEASMQGNETFGVETYYVRDILEVETVGDTMYFTTHGHASLADNTLLLQDTSDMDVEVDNDTIVFIQKD